MFLRESVWYSLKSCSDDSVALIVEAHNVNVKALISSVVKAVLSILSSFNRLALSHKCVSYCKENFSRVTQGCDMESTWTRFQWHSRTVQNMGKNGIKCPEIHLMHLSLHAMWTVGDGETGRDDL